MATKVHCNVSVGTIWAAFRYVLWTNVTGNTLQASSNFLTEYCCVNALINFPGLSECNLFNGKVTNEVFELRPKPC